jgi:Protein of unknown function (DUF4232)
MRVRTILIAGTTVVLLTAAAACGGGETTAGGTPPIANTTTAAPPPTTQPTTTTSPAPTTTTTTTRKPTSAPAPMAFRADLTIQRAGLGLLALTNTGRSAETVTGWPKLAFLNAANEPVAVPVREVNVPGKGAPITVGPGETVFAGVRWVVGDKADPKTFVATTVRLTPPGATGASTVRVIGTNGQAGGYTEFDLTSAQVGTLQPSSQGVLVF